MITTNLDVERFYRTTDLGLAAALALFYSLEAIDRLTEQPKAQFVFKQNNKLNELIDAYWNGQLQVDAQGYFQKLRAVKTRLYGEG